MSAQVVHDDSAAGWYIGADDSDPDRSSWFLRLNRDGRGALYGSRWIDLCEWHRSPDGGFGFRRALWFGKVTYDGFAGADTIRGTLKGISRSYGRVTFRRVDRVDRTPAVLGGKGGVYSTARYNQEAGDMTGAELVAGTVNGAAMMPLVPPPLVISNGPAIRFAFGLSRALQVGARCSEMRPYRCGMMRQ